MSRLRPDHRGGRLRQVHGPRRVNNVTTACLLAGFVERKSLIDEATATKALAEFQDDLGG